MKRTPADQARHMLAMGIVPIQVPYKSKAIRRPGWPDERTRAEDIDHLFGSGQTNIGMLMGEPSGWVVDIDLDHELAVELADEYLPPTSAVFGRASSPRSHRLYRITSPCETRKWPSKTAGMIVELRSTGMQTIGPGSVHPTGEAVEWAEGEDGEPAEITPEELVAAVEALARAVKRNLGESSPQTQEARSTSPARLSTTPYGLKALNSEADEVAGTAPGGRNDRLNKAAFGVGQLVGGGEVDEATSVDALQHAARECGLGDSEARATIASGLNKGMQSPRSAPTTADRRTSQSPVPHPRCTAPCAELPADFQACPDAVVLVVEHERAEDAARACGFVVTTIASVAGEIGLSNCDNLAGRDVVIVPSHCTRGEDWAADMVHDAHMVGAHPVRVVRIAERWPDLPKDGDLADVLELERGDGAEVRVEVEALIDAAEPETNADAEPLLVFDISAMFPPNAAFAYRFFVDMARSTQTPIEMSALLGLAIASACVANVAQVRGHGDHIEPAQIWALVLSEPGTRKSAVLSELLRPIIAWESEQAKELGPEIAAVEQRHRITQQRIKLLEGDAAKAKDPSKREQYEREAVTLAQELEADPVPRPPVLLACEPTPEALTRQMADNDGRALLASAEGDALDIIQGRYSGSRNYGTMLKGHAGDPIRVQRIGRAGEVIDRPALAVALCIQRAAVEALWADPQAEGRGLLARFQVIAPPDLVGSREIRPAPIDDANRTDWRDAIDRLLSFTPGDEPVMIELSANADSIYFEYQVRIEAALGHGELADRRAWGGKLCGLVLRVALTLHALSKWAYSGTPTESGLIDGPTMAAAIAWADYLTAAERAARGVILEDDTTRDRRELESWIHSRGGSTSVKELQDGMRRKYPLAIDAETALDGLVDSEGTHWEQIPPGPNGGRPSKRLVLNSKRATAKRKTPPSTLDNAGSAFCGTDGDNWTEV